MPVRHDSTGEAVEYMSVSSKEEDIFIGKLCSDTPVGQAILGKRKGDTVEVTTPAGIFSYTIMKISRPKG